jgi:hypothetical protein
MRCDECAPLLEDALYHKLVATTEKDLAEHLTACDSCAREYALLRSEQELYARSELQIAPDFWTGVQARIARENGLGAQRFAGLFNLLRASPVGVAIACLLIVVGSIGLWRFIELRPGHTITAELQTPPPVSVAKTDQTTEQKRDAVALTDSKRDGEKRGTSGHRPFVAKRTNLRSPVASRTYTTKIEKPVFVADAVVEQTQRSVASDLDADSARHLEQVGMLLRSFKNSRSLRHSNTLDLAYEKRLSKDLLARHVLLRRDAESAGDVPLSRLLDQLEPFLVDIANLRDNSDSKEIRQVRNGLTKAQVIAALHSF